MEMYQELHMWDECIAVAEAKVSVFNIIFITSSQQFLVFFYLKQGFSIGFAQIH